MSNVLESRPVDTITNASRDALAAARTALPQRLFEPVDIASLVFFRLAFGSIMLWETWRYYDHGWIGRYFTGKEFYFTYWPFDFVQPWPGDGMFIHFGLMAVFAACIVLGLFYRVSATAFFLMFTYVFLLEQPHPTREQSPGTWFQHDIFSLPCLNTWDSVATLKPQGCEMV